MSFNYFQHQRDLENDRIFEATVDRLKPREREAVYAFAGRTFGFGLLAGVLFGVVGSVAVEGLIRWWVTR